MQFHLKHTTAFIFLFFFHFLSAEAQRFYHAVQDVPLSGQEQALSIPWAGGLNTAIFQTADLSGDGQEELIALDRSSQSLSAFAWGEQGWEAKPELACLLPQDLSNWFIMQDYDNDGRKDVFTFTSSGIRVFRNIAEAGKPAAWEAVAETLTYEAGGRQINLLVNSLDLPAIEDVDGDGDLDVLTYSALGGGGLEYYRNRSVEQNLPPEAFAFVKESSRWGGIRECDCGEFSFRPEDECEGGSGHRLQHTGGKSLLLSDMDGDGDLDLLNGFEECETLYYLENKGSSNEPFFDSFSTHLPGTAEEVAMGFPAAFLVDVEQSGREDLVVSSQLSRNSNLLYDFSESVWWLKQSASAGGAGYQLKSRAFLQEEMLDAGESATPAFFDWDGDKDLDLLLGSAGEPEEDGFYAGLRLYENTGTRQSPAYELKNDDLLQLKARRFMNLVPQIVDFNSDGSADLLLLATETERFQRKALLFKNKAGASSAPAFGGSDFQELPVSLSVQDNPFFFDVSGDKLPDLLVGRFDGSLSYFENVGTANNPAFGPETKNYLGLGLENYRRPLVPSVGDLTGNGQPDLLLAEGTGSIRYVENFLQNQQGTVIPKDIQLCEGNKEAVSWFGRKSWPVAAQLREGEAPLLVVGTLMGGLWMLQTGEGLPAPPEGKGLLLEVFPNPVAKERGYVFVRASSPATLRVFGIAGQLLAVFQLGANEKTAFSTAGMAAGIYLIQAESAVGKSYRKLIVVE